MIRIHLTSDDVARIRIADAPDINAELVWAGYRLAYRVRTQRLARWWHELAPGWNPGITRVYTLYTRTALPGLLDPSFHPDPALTAKAVAATDPGEMGEYLRSLTYSRPMTPFARELAEGREPAYAALGQAVADLQAIAVDPYRRRIASHVATEAARVGARAAAAGIGALLDTLHPQVSWDGRTVGVASANDYDVELDGRALVLRGSVFATKPGISGSMFEDALELYYPVAGSVLERDARLEAPSAALAALLGSTRAAALTAVAGTPAITTGQLAAALGLSGAAASRHASVLREAGLIATFRNGMTVHHHPTRLGAELAGRPDPDARHITGPTVRGDGGAHSTR